MARTGSAVGAGVARLNALPAGEAERELLDCCASPAWARALVGARPYPDRPALLAASDEVLAALPWAHVEEALAAHPRIGERATGPDRAASWSRGEQAAATTAAADVRTALADGNAEYERRFGHVYLVRATGRGAEELLAILRGRLGNDPATERQVVRDELAAITRLRLEKWLAEERPRWR